MRPGFLSLVAAVAAGISGCAFDFGFDGTRYRCGAGGACPPGQICVGGFCEAGGGDDDADIDADPNDPDAATDAPTDGMIVSSACGTLDLLRDDFATAGDGPFWDPFNAANVTLGESSGRLVIDLAPGADGYGGYESFYLYDLHGGGIVAQVVETSADNTILEVRNHLGNKAQLVEQNGQISASLYNVPSPGPLVTRPWNTAETYWRIREENGDMVWETSANATSWNLLHRRTLPFDVSHVHGIVAAGGTVSALSRSSFEQVNPATPAVSYCPAVSLRDDFAASGLFPLWYAYTNAGCTQTETGGDLVMTYTAGASSSFCGMDGSHLYDFSTSDGLTLDASTFPTVANFVSYVQAAVPGPNDGNRIEMTADTGTLEMRIMMNDTEVSGLRIAFSQTTHRWWRMRGTGSTVFFETSTDRVVWTERHRGTAPFSLAGLDVNIGAGRYGMIASPLTITIPGINAD